MRERRATRKTNCARSVWTLAIWVGLATAGSVRAQQQPFEDFSCVSFPADLSEARLISRYGRENVRRARVRGADESEDGAIVFDGTPRQLEVVWWDPEARSELSWIGSHEGNSTWRTPNGLSIGMDLQHIERRNGWPFRLRGLTGPEGLGVIKSWGRGRLRDANDDGCAVRISLQPANDRRIDPALYRQVSRGDFSSGHPAMQAINPRVAWLVVTHNPAQTRSAPR